MKPEKFSKEIYNFFNCCVQSLNHSYIHPPNNMPFHPSPPPFALFLATTVSQTSIVQIYCYWVIYVCLCAFCHNMQFKQL